MNKPLVLALTRKGNTLSEESDVVGGLEAPAAEAAIDTDLPDGLGEQAESDAPAEAPSPESETEEPRYTVKVDGQALEVSYDELINGFQRQADYTRKTQELADQREALAQQAAFFDAFEEDPEGMLNRLAPHFGLQLTKAEIEALETADPRDAELAEIREFVQAQQEAAAIQEIETELDGLRGVHGEFDRDALLRFASENEILDLEAALLKQRALNERDAAVRARNEAALAAKKNAPAVAGGSSAVGATTSGATSQPQSFEEALKETLAEAGLTSLSQAR